MNRQILYFNNMHYYFIIKTFYTVLFSMSLFFLLVYAVFVFKNACYLNCGWSAYVWNMSAWCCLKLIN